MKLKGISALFCVVLVGFLAWAQGGLLPADVPGIECETLFNLMKKDVKLALVDVRAPSDFREAHIAGAVSVPFYKLPKEAAWPKWTSLVLYCAGKGCPLSYDSALALIKEGYKDVKVLSGGIREWELKEYPIVRDEKAKETQPQIRENTVFKGRTVTAKQLSEQLKTLQSPGDGKEGQTGEKGGNILILDLRPESEFEAAHLPGSKNIPFEQLEEKMKNLPKGSEVIVCDKTAERSEAAVLILNKAGFPAHSLMGGIMVWSMAGYQLAAGEGYEK